MHNLREDKMKNIRSGVFETNSSSTHSIAIAEDADGILDTIVPDADGTIVFIGGEFGWSWEKFNDPMTKANYCAVDLQSNPASMTMLSEVISQHTGAKRIVFSIDRDSSYVDHQSVGTSEDAFANTEALKNFIFNPKSWLFTGNDNDYAPPNFHDVDLNIVYSHSLTIDGVNKCAKFKTYPTDEELIDCIEALCGEHADMQYSDGRDEDGYFVSKEPFKLATWERIDTNGNKYHSFNSLNDRFITVYKTKTVYSKDNSKYIGDNVIASKQISFHINEL